MSGYSINFNPNMHNALRGTERTQTAANKALQRMQSGKRIIKNSDDIAGSMLVAGLRSEAKTRIQGIANLREGLGILALVDSAVSSAKEHVEEIAAMYLQGYGAVRSPQQIAQLSTAIQGAWAAYKREIMGAAYAGKRLLTGGFAARGVFFGEGCVTLGCANLSCAALSHAALAAGMNSHNGAGAARLLDPFCDGAHLASTVTFSNVGRAEILSGCNMIASYLAGVSANIGMQQATVEAVVRGQEAEADACEIARSLIEDIDLLSSQKDAAQAAALKQAATSGWLLVLEMLQSDASGQQGAIGVVSRIVHG
ncbi:MAG: hypothetical protein LBB04_03420 [Oscillospiraceae bacterium]|jgi:flagellin-like hook-associated protein FlgL|nr:hypothetical protein [Oscillospiraceae bacterium]